MAAEVEEFVRRLDLSNLTHAIVKEKFKKHMKKDSLTKEEKMQLKQAVEKVLLENEDDESSDDDVPLSVKAELLRKEKYRSRARDSNGGDGKVNGRTQLTKKTRTHSPSSDSGKGKRGVRARRASTSAGSSDTEEEGEGDHQQPPPAPDQRAARRLEEEARESDRVGRSSKPQRREESGSEDRDRVVSRRSQGSEGEESSSSEDPPSDTGRGAARAQREQEETGDQGQTDAESSSSDESSRSEKSSSVRDRGDEAQRGSSTDSSSESEEDGEAGGGKGQRRTGKGHNRNNSKRKAQPKERRQDEHPTLKRLKRYIVACGVRRNYKKLFADCRTDKSRIRVLRRELEELGIKGNPSLEKCKALRFKRDEEAELASLDVANIIHSEGRPRRRRGTSWDLDPIRPESYKRTLPSDSDEELEERPRKLTMWSNLQGLISDDCESE
ncbi:HIRA-interacting protein 3 [Chiloscyllium punctatum]|uniref:HIRA-interacting protein 3 n=1 Tax=Chiloscyllium punctatum TaxID=137246 RepID=UPI003B638185